jgi:TatD DNase family protein
MFSQSADAMLIDSHCHLDFPDFANELDAILARAEAAGIGKLVTISTRVRCHDAVLAIAERFDRVYCSVGTHPHNAHEELDIGAHDLIARAVHPKVVGIGEAGLDFHYAFSPRSAQEQGLRTHIAAARETGLPLIIHARNADAEIARVLLEEYAVGKFGAVLHCFTGSRELALAGIRLGFYVSFSGILTFKKSDKLRALAAELPGERILVETDAPYLAPQPWRGKRNEPAWVRETARVLAQCRGQTPEAIAQLTTNNFYRLFAKVPRLAGAPA